MADRRQHVLELAALRPGVVDVVRHDDRQPELVGEGRRLGHEPVVVRQEVVRELEIEAAPGNRAGECRRGRPGALPIADPQPPGDLALATARQRDEALGVLGEQLVAEARHGLRPGEVRPRDEPAQAPIARCVAGEEDEVRTALALADPALILLDRLPMTGQPSPLGAGPIRPALDGRSTRSSRRLRAMAVAPRRRPPRRAGRRAGTTSRSGSGTIASSSSISTPMTGRIPAASAAAGEPDGAVEALVVGDRQAGQAELDRPLDQLVGRPTRRRGTRSWCGSGARRRVPSGRSMIEQMFYSGYPSDERPDRHGRHRGMAELRRQRC